MRDKRQLFQNVKVNNTFMRRVDRRDAAKLAFAFTKINDIAVGLEFIGGEGEVRCHFHHQIILLASLGSAGELTYNVCAFGCTLVKLDVINGTFPGLVLR